MSLVRYMLPYFSPPDLVVTLLVYITLLVYLLIVDRMEGIYYIEK